MAPRPGPSPGTRPVRRGRGSPAARGSAERARLASVFLGQWLQSKGLPAAAALLQPLSAQSAESEGVQGGCRWQPGRVLDIPKRLVTCRSRCHFPRKSLVGNRRSSSPFKIPSGNTIFGPQPLFCPLVWHPVFLASTDGARRLTSTGSRRTFRKPVPKAASSTTITGWRRIPLRAQSRYVPMHIVHTDAWRTSFSNRPRLQGR